MAKYVDRGYMETEQCCSCGITFAMTQEFTARRKKDQNWFYCPAGHRQHYTGKTKEQKLRAELDLAHRDADQAHQEAAEQRQLVGQISRSYNRVRERVKNGVCPCCNRTFENLARHMASKHPEYGNNKQLRTMRLAYGLTQEQVADEVGVSVSYISRYERGMELPASGEARLAEWLRQQTA